MGRASEQKKLRREVVSAMLASAQFNAMNAAPAVVAVHAAMAADAELQARWRADLPAQRTRLRRAGWARAAEGSDGAGWWKHPGSDLTMVHSVSREGDGNLWGHFSLSHGGERLPGWYALRDMQWLLYPELAGIQVVAPQEDHVSIAEVLHIWTCLTAGVLPAFGRHGSI